MDLKTIALNSRAPLAKLKEFTRGYNDGQRVGSRHIQTRVKRIGREPMGHRIFSLPGGPA